MSMPKTAMFQAMCAIKYTGNPLEARVLNGLARVVAQSHRKARYKSKGAKHNAGRSGK